MGKERLQKLLARAGYGSRRTSETIIEEGRVTVDGQVAQLGDKADPETQEIRVDGVPIRMPQRYTYLMFNKPRGVITTTDDPQGRRTVLDYVNLPQRLYPVGRLDADSEGLLLLTDDGTLTQRLTHPRYGHERVYRVLVGGEPSAETLERWRRGIILDGKKTGFDKVVVESEEHGKAWLRVTVSEGRKHLVRRVVAALGHPALRLIRVKMGPLELGDLSSGRWRNLTTGEVKALQKQVGIAGRSGGRSGGRRGGKSRRSGKKSGGQGQSSRRSSRRSQDRKKGKKGRK